MTNPPPHTRPVMRNKPPDRLRHNGVEFVSTREALNLMGASAWKLKQLVQSKAIRVFKIPELRTSREYRAPNYFRLDDLVPYMKENDT